MREPLRIVVVAVSVDLGTVRKRGRVSKEGKAFILACDQLQWRERRTGNTSRRWSTSCSNLPPHARTRHTISDGAGTKTWNNAA